MTTKTDPNQIYTIKEFYIKVKGETTRTNDEAYQFIKLYDILRDMDMPLTSKQHSVFEKVLDAQTYSTYQGA